MITGENDSQCVFCADFLFEKCFSATSQSYLMDGTIQQMNGITGPGRRDNPTGKRKGKKKKNEATLFTDQKGHTKTPPPTNLKEGHQQFLASWGALSLPISTNLHRQHGEGTCKRFQTQKATRCGLYEEEGQGWTKGKKQQYDHYQSSKQTYSSPFTESNHRWEARK